MWRPVQAHVHVVAALVALGDVLLIKLKQLRQLMVKH
jgi:hypothetical protein